MIRAFRWTIGASEVLGGALLMAIPLWQIHVGSIVPAWFLALAELLGAVSIAGGTLLVRRHPLGRSISFIVQVLQVAQVQVARFGYGLIAGVQVCVVLPAKPYWLHFGFYGSLTIVWHTSTDAMIGVNLFSLAAAVALASSWQSAPIGASEPNGAVLPNASLSLKTND